MMDRSDVTLERMRTFCPHCRSRELVGGRAANSASVSRQSRGICEELEDAVGVPLLSRTTRRLTLTDEGSRYYANSINILRLVEQAGGRGAGHARCAGWLDPDILHGGVRGLCTSAGCSLRSRIAIRDRDRPQPHR